MLTIRLLYRFNNLTGLSSQPGFRNGAEEVHCNQRSLIILPSFDYLSLSQIKYPHSILFELPPTRTRRTRSHHKSIIAIPLSRSPESRSCVFLREDYRFGDLALRV